MDKQWVIGYLNEALTLCTLADSPSNPLGAEEKLIARWPILEEIVQRVGGGSPQKLRTAGEMQVWRGVADELRPAIYQLEHAELLAEKLAPEPGPRLRADALHPLVWGAAESFWRSHHRREAVQAAAKSVNAQLHDRLGRRDVNEVDAVRQAFTLDPPTPQAGRLRLMEGDGSQTFRSLHEGVSQFGAGCFKALRNPPAHEPMEELGEHEALEQLAAFSILARWIEQAELVTADETDHPT